MVEKVEFLDNLLCSVCLCVGRELSGIADDNLRQFYFNTIQEIPLNSTAISPSLCWECVVLLRKGHAFREQVKDSFRILETYSNENLRDRVLTEVSQPPRFRTTTVTVLSIPPTVQIDGTGELETVIVKDELWQEEDSQRDVKDEHSDNDNRSYHSDKSRNYESDIEEPLINIKNTRKRRKNVKQKIKNLNMDPIDSKQFLEVNIEDVDDSRTTTMETVIVKDELSQKEDSQRDSQQFWEVNIEDVDDSQTLKEIKLKNVKNKKKELKKQSKSNIRSTELTEKEVLAFYKTPPKLYLEAEYKCSLCLVVLKNEAALKHHEKCRHDQNIGEYVCPICKTVLGSVDGFTSHYMKHLKGYECIECGEKSIYKKSIQEHCKRVHSKRPQYTCELCGKVSNTIDSHRYHRDTHRARLQCPQCDKTFRHRVGLANHTLSAHKEHNKFPCEVCGKVLKWKSSLKKHMETHQGRRNPLSLAYCQACDVRFLSFCSLRRHLRSSLKHVSKQELRFICDHCNKRFANKTKLRDHIEEKHLHKTYQCSICLKPSKNRVTLDQHIRNVHRGRPHNKICHLCGKGFPTKLQLESHIRSHTGEKPFICEYCPSAFSQPGNLYKHYRQIHQH